MAKTNAALCGAFLSTLDEMLALVQSAKLRPHIMTPSKQSPWLPLVDCIKFTELDTLLHGLAGQLQINLTPPPPPHGIREAPSLGHSKLWISEQRRDGHYLWPEDWQTRMAAHRKLLEVMQGKPKRKREKTSPVKPLVDKYLTADSQLTNDEVQTKVENTLHENVDDALIRRYVSDFFELHPDKRPSFRRQKPNKQKA
jgi:hypothetical protein